jgi:hypothetical protein
MSKSKRVINEKLFTPKVRVKYNGLAVPYFYKKRKEDDKEDKRGSYSITVVGSPSELSDWMDNMTAIREDLLDQQRAQENNKRMPDDGNMLWVDEIDKDTDTETGNILAKFKHAAKGFNGKTGSTWDNKVAVVDAFGKPFAPENIAKIGRGSIVKVAYNMVAYTVGPKVGVKFELIATQVIKLEVFSGESREAAFAGQVEEEGYSVDEGVEF